MIKSKQFYLFLSLLGLFITKVNGQTTQIIKLSLGQAIETAQKNNATFLNAQLDKELAQKKVKEIMAMGLPQVSGQVQFLHNAIVPTQALPDFISPAVYGNLVRYGLVNPNDPNTPPPPVQVFGAQFGVKNNLTASITASQLLFDGGFLMGLKASKEYVNLSNLTTEQAKIELDLNVKKAYYSVLVLQVTVDMLNNNLKLLEKTSSEITAIYKVGLGEKIDADRLKLSLSNTTIERDKLTDQLAIAKQFLKLNLGVEPNDSLILTDDLTTFKTTENINNIANGDYSQRIEMKVLEQQKTLNNLDKKRWQYGYIPSLAAFGNYLRNTFGANFNEVGKTWYEGASIGATLSIPLFDGLKKSSLIQQSKINDRKIENGRNILKQSIEIERYSAKSKFIRAQQLYTLQNDNSTLAKDIFNRANIKYKEGLGSTLELTSAQTDLLNAESNRLRALFDLLVADAEYKKALGY